MSLIDLGKNAVFGAPLEDSQYQCDIFVIMPFADEFTPIYEDHLISAANSLGLSIKRGDNFFSKRSIMTDVWSALSNARLVIADCTGRNPNVFYELGMAHTLDKSVIMITQNMDDIPFDVRHLRVIRYNYTPRGMSGLENALIEAINALLNNISYIDYLRNNPSEFPSDKDEQAKIVDNLLRNRDFDTYDRIWSYITSGKVKVINKLIEIKELDRAAKLASTVEGAGSLRDVGLALYNAGLLDIPLMEDVIRRIVSNTELRAFARQVYREGNGDSDFFRHLVNSFTSAPELKNLATYFLNDGRSQSLGFDYIVEYFAARKGLAQLKSLAIELIDRNLTDSSQFKRIITSLEQDTARLGDVLTYWVEHSRPAAEVGLNQGILTKSSSIDYLKNLLS